MSPRRPAGAGETRAGAAAADGGATRGARARWRYVFGRPPNTFVAEERDGQDRGRRIVEIRWWVRATRRFRRISTGRTVRDDRGRLDEAACREVVRQTQAVAHAVLAGADPRSVSEGAADAGAPLTLADGFALATRVPHGLYVTESEHLREVRRAAAAIVQLIGTTDKGVPQTWDALRPSAVRRIWVAMAEQYRRTRRGGPSWAERCVVLLLQVSQWLASEEHVDRVPVMKRTWREQLRREWEQITGTRVRKHTPRHSEAEIRRIFAALDHPDVDPRIALALELGAEARLGQVRRLRRSDVDLEPIGHFGLGRITVRGEGKKLGVVRDLTPEERAALDRAFAGYLAPLERAYRAGARADYPIFPPGRLRYDVPPSRRPQRHGRFVEVPLVRRARADVPDAPLDDHALLDMFHALERVAGVEPAPGRGWYGIRRRAADIYEDHETDERVLNDQTGHADSETRRAIYQERQREAILAKSAETRRRVRTTAFGRTSPPSPDASARSRG